jgi:CHAT domain-containing protein
MHSGNRNIPTKLSLFFIFCIWQATVTAQKQVTAQPEIENALAANNLAAAEAIIQKQTTVFLAQKRADSLNNYVFYTGKVAQLKTNAEAGVKKVQELVQQIKALSPSPAILRQTYLEAGEYYGFAGKNNLAYSANAEALRYAQLLPGKPAAQLATIESNMGTYAQRMGNIGLSEQHQRRAFQYRLADPTTDAESMYVSYNNMGSIMYYASKLDSAVMYFNKALQTLSKAERTPVNQHYRPALVLNNVSGIYSLQGKTTEAINALKTCILNLRTFIASKEPHLKKNSALSLQFEATDNLAGIYKELGNYKQAHDLLLHSFREKQLALDKNDPAIFISQILLGQLYYAMKDYDKALQFLHTGLESIGKADGDHSFWKADACHTLALLHDDRKNREQAAMFYQRADELYEASLQGDYDNIYLEFISNAALFYAENGDTQTALAKAQKAYRYITETQGTETLSASYQLLNLAEVHQLAGNFMQALQYSNHALAVMKKAARASSSLLDSVKTELKLPKAILQKARAEYALLKTKDKEALRHLLASLNEALSIIERRKAILTDAEDIGLLMADQSGLMTFIEKINVDLFKLTGERAYLDRSIGLHEAALYNRIRSRLDRADTVQFAHVPPAVLARERSLKTTLAQSLEGSGTHHQKMQAYFTAVDEWTQFREKLKKEHPRYYQLRHASITNPLENLRRRIPTGTTLVRYLFSEKELFALVADERSENIVPLGTPDIDKHIITLASNRYDLAVASHSLWQLYQQLWKPLEKAVRHKKLLIIPDGILHNLSFETLTPGKISSFKELGTKSLLATHAIAYHYSLHLVNPQSGGKDHPASFVAFAPGFTEQIKQPYRSAAANTFPDANYLALLPQPFTIDLATKTQKMLGGELFLHNESTVNSFRQHAGNHKVIHVGTHAESDNLHPEFSRLIFAKAGSGDDNSLYLPEIYNCDLTAELAVLTACESGKPGYEDGEGMVSLAHAFHYAGSKSMLTGLWKIDEQASALVMELFYKHLLAGLSKDEALRQAKLDYLQQANGRMLAPQYWAGLILIGDTSPIALEEHNGLNRRWVIIAAALLVFVAAVFWFLQRANK